VVLVVAVVVDATSFITASDASKEAFKTANLLKTLTVNSLILGEDGVGKQSLAHYILPDAPIMDASDFDELLTTLESSHKVVILNLHNAPNIKTITDMIQKNSTHVVATAKETFLDDSVEELFSVKFSIPPLSQRQEDVSFLIQRFTKEASKLFGGDVNSFDTKKIVPDLSQNANSLRRQVMINYLLQDIGDRELIGIMENYLSTKIGSNNDYKKFLYLYETPLIKAGLNKFKSQLQLADKLGLNRNTLRKKIADNKEYL
jgi:DNA-binding NtrC family response regulator